MTDKYAVVGNPVKHSKSPQLQQLFADDTGEDISYGKIRIEEGDFEAEIRKLQAQGYKGLNVTLPFKVDAFHLADALSQRAQLAGAVNTLIFHTDGRIEGDNTDGIGLVNDIKQTLSLDIKDKSILIIGAGGAVRGVVGPLLDQKPKSLTVYNRTQSKAEALVELFDSNTLSVSPTLTGKYDLIINGTSAAATGQSLDFSTLTISPKTACYDMMYSQALTPFLSFAKDQGATQLADGLGMLIRQGAESFRIWRGKQPDTSPAFKALRT